MKQGDIYVLYIEKEDEVYASYDQEKLLILAGKFTGETYTSDDIDDHGPGDYPEMMHTLKGNENVMIGATSVKGEISNGKAFILSEQYGLGPIIQNIEEAISPDSIEEFNSKVQENKHKYDLTDEQAYHETLSYHGLDEINVI